MKFFAEYFFYSGFKRSVSERKTHVHALKVREIDSFALTDRGTDGLCWLVQPKLKQFEEHNEIRLYFVGSKFLWGVSSRFDENDEMSLFSFGPGRWGG
ncbi:MAG: hypothetical protein KDA17_06855, partial [Candidatus Saccharibacteria bacterium]|nr:hypothetical protein [Candidatus Saccharibacteria bacterium]